jgi:hypothetical protein
MSEPEISDINYDKLKIDLKFPAHIIWKMFKQKKSSFEKVISCDNWNANQKEIITIKLDDYLNDCEMIVFIF